MGILECASIHLNFLGMATHHLFKDLFSFRWSVSKTLLLSIMINRYMFPLPYIVNELTKLPLCWKSAIIVVGFVEGCGWSGLCAGLSTWRLVMRLMTMYQVHVCFARL